MKSTIYGEAELRASDPHSWSMTSRLVLQAFDQARRFGKMDCFEHVDESLHHTHVSTY